MGFTYGAGVVERWRELTDIMFDGEPIKVTMQRDTPGDTMIVYVFAWPIFRHSSDRPDGVIQSVQYRIETGDDPRGRFASVLGLNPDIPLPSDQTAGWQTLVLAALFASDRYHVIAVH